MKVWTFQSLSAGKLLKEDDTYYASWTFVQKSLVPAYQWVVKQMEFKGLSPNGHPPIWVWYKYGGSRTKFKNNAARDLLSEDEIKAGIYKIELDVPEQLCLLSSYFNWNVALDFTLATGLSPDSIFSPMLDKNSLDGQKNIQGCLPCILRHWIIGISPLTL